MVGEPGVGKSRLVAELFAYIDDRPDLIRWRQGRCLPYGDGITFWALGEIVKAQCGHPRVRSPEEAAAKLERALPEDDPDAPGSGPPRAAGRRARRAGAPRRSPSPPGAASWSRWPPSRPTVLVFEDLHWADDALLAFLEHLADWSRGVPLLLVCTARPELYERHPAWAARRATRPRSTSRR